SDPASGPGPGPGLATLPVLAPVSASGIIPAPVRAPPQVPVAEERDADWRGRAGNNDDTADEAEDTEEDDGNGTTKRVSIPHTPKPPIALGRDLFSPARPQPPPPLPAKSRRRRTRPRIVTETFRTPLSPSVPAQASATVPAPVPVPAPILSPTLGPSKRRSEKAHAVAFVTPPSSGASSPVERDDTKMSGALRDDRGLHERLQEENKWLREEVRRLKAKIRHLRRDGHGGRR
ncbi:hypothetical protein AOQ84DRAFT_383393, partial [Glonium stellatum]